MGPGPGDSSNFPTLAVADQRLPERGRHASVAAMLRLLQIRDFAIVPALELEFGSGFTAITGETGAGKSIMVDALGLLAGNRADTNAIRDGADKAELLAEFELRPDHPAQEWLAAAELEEDDLCLIRRVISRSGRSRAWINGRAVTLNQLQDLGSRLIEIHGQNEHMSLTRQTEQIGILDRAPESRKALGPVVEAYQAWHALNGELLRLNAQAPLDAGELDLLNYQLEELEAETLEDSAIEALETEHRRLSKGSELAAAIAQAAESLDAEPGGVSVILNRTLTSLEPLVDLDAELSDAVAMLREAAINVDEASAAVARCSASLDLSPERLAELDQQLNRLGDLARKHQVSLEELAAVKTRLEERVASAAQPG